LAALGVLTALADPFLIGRVYLRDDLGAFHLPTRAFYGEQLARGEPFDWMPQLHSGFYLTGEGQAGTYHPWHWLLYRFLPLGAALSWEWLSAYPFLLSGTWLFLRRRLDRADAALAGALFFTFSSFNLLHFIHPNAVAVVAHIPWLLWAIDVVMLDHRRWKVAAAQAGIALLTGSQLLLGYPQYVWFSLLAETGYVAFLLVHYHRAPRQGCSLRATCESCIGCQGSSWPRLVIAKSVGLLLGGAQLLPTLDGLAHSTRGAADAAFTKSGSLHPLNLVQLVAPYLFPDRVLGGGTHELSVYAGAVPLMLVAWLVVRRRELGELRPLVLAAGGMAVFALFLAFGQYGGLYRLQSYLPLVGRFRCPCRYLVLFQLSLAVLAAVGFVLLEREGRQSRQPPKQKDREMATDALCTNDPSGTAHKQCLHSFPNRLLDAFEGLWAVVFVSISVALAGLCLHNQPHIAAPGRVLVGPLLIVVAAALVVAAARGVRGALTGLILFAMADLGWYGVSFAVAGSDMLGNFVAAAATPASACLGTGETASGELSRSLFQGKGTGAADHRSPDQGRVFAPPEIVQSCAVYTGDQMILACYDRTDGYTGLEPRRQLDYCQLPALQVSDTRWVQRNSTTADIRGLIPRGAQWWEVPDPLPRVRLVAKAVVSEEPARDLPRIDIRTTALCPSPLELSGGTPGTAVVRRQRPGLFDIEVRCSGRQLLVISESFHDGWQATVDGKARPLVQVNGDFLGCVVEPGLRTVLLEFKPGSLARGLWASTAGLLLMLLCFSGEIAVGRLRRRRLLVADQSPGVKNDARHPGPVDQSPVAARSRPQAPSPFFPLAP
jgi:hypothetical protein